jgi:subtilisin family serine protease
MTSKTIQSVPKVRRELQGGQTIPYGVRLVKATDFWAAYDNKGSGKTVCVIDTGLWADHEDGDIKGSGPWDQDGNSRGSHVTGTIAAVENNVGVVGVAPEASIHVARDKKKDGGGCEDKNVRHSATGSLLFLIWSF